MTEYRLPKYHFFISTDRKKMARNLIEKHAPNNFHEIDYKK